MNFPPSNFKNTSVLFFYNGTAFPQVVDAPDVEQMFHKNANEMILRGIRGGLGMEQQKKEYKEQLDLMEQTLVDTVQGKMMDGASIDRAWVILGLKDRQHFYTLWCLNICALLKMKVIKNDNENGVLSSYIEGSVRFSM